MFPLINKSHSCSTRQSRGGRRRALRCAPRCLRAAAPTRSSRSRLVAPAETRSEKSPQSRPAKPPAGLPDTGKVKE